jgi:hypothetical protein
MNYFVVFSFALGLISGIVLIAFALGLISGIVLILRPVVAIAKLKQTPGTCIEEVVVRFNLELVFVFALGLVSGVVLICIVNPKKQTDIEKAVAELEEWVRRTMSLSFSTSTGTDMNPPDFFAQLVPSTSCSFGLASAFFYGVVNAAAYEMFGFMFALLSSVVSVISATCISTRFKWKGKLGILVGATLVCAITTGYVWHGKPFALFLVIIFVVEYNRELLLGASEMLLKTRAVLLLNARLERSLRSIFEEGHQAAAA